MISPAHFVKQTLVAALAMLTMLHAGCVALNIPSQRIHDPSDEGGILGHWKRGASHAVHQGAETVNMMVEDPGCIDGGPLDSSGGPDCIGGGGSVAPPQPEVPWPRFHPIPTRPVFGT